MKAKNTTSPKCLALYLNKPLPGFLIGNRMLKLPTSLPGILLVLTVGIFASPKVVAAPPVIATQPQGSTNVVGSDVTISASVSGTSPLSFQWKFNGNNLSDATNATLNLHNVQTSQSGNYSLMASNGEGSVSSSNAFLSVIVQPAGHVVLADGFALKQALAGGGTVSFDVDGIIPLSQTLVITQNTVLNGNGHNVTISGNNSVRVFQVNPAVTLTLANLTVANGLATGTNGADSFGGGLYNDSGIVNLVGVTFATNSAVGGSANIAGGGYGGGVYNKGTLNVTNSVFAMNRAEGGVGGPASFLGVTAGRAAGGAIYNQGGSLNLSNNIFVSNISTGGTYLSDGISAGNTGDARGGALYSSTGLVTVVQCSFSQNIAQAPLADGRGGFGSIGSGGAIHLDSGTMQLIQTSFQTNSAMGSPTTYLYNQTGNGFGAGVFNKGTLNCTNCTFLGNTVQGGTFGQVGGYAYGGGICNLGTANIVNATLAGNLVVGGGGGEKSGIFASGPGGTGNGGGIYNSNVVLLIGTTLSGNVALGGPGGVLGTFSGDGANAYGGGICNAGSLIATNNTLFGNMAVGGDAGYLGAGVLHPLGGNGYGGAIYNTTNGTMTLTHLTIAGNGAKGGLGNTNTMGIGVGGGVVGQGGTVTLRNSIVANSTSGGNCFGDITDGGGNISSDASFSFSASGSHTNTDPVLGPLANYGGPTETMALLAGSPAINAGLTAFCPPTDQRGIARPFGGACDIGAFESAPPYSIRGRVNAANPAGISVSTGTNSVVTDGFGNYVLNGFAAGTYAVTASAEGMTFVPPTSSVTVGPDAVGVDFNESYPARMITREGQTNGVMQFIFAGTVGQTYELQVSTDLASWTPVSTNTISASGFFQFSATNNTVPGPKYWRTVLH
jgi:fibronectin-binding autotransporter adhesin